MELCVFVFILFQPVIVCTLSNLVPVIEGNRKELAAPTEADSIPRNRIDNIVWFNDANQNAKNVLVQLSDPTNGRFSIDKSETTYGDLIIEPTQRSDSGPYTCQVKLHDLNVWDVTYQLDVYYMDPPHLSGPFRDDNGNITFYCDWSNINPYKTPSVTWNCDGTELNTSRNGYKLKEREGRTLVILDPSERDVGSYTCAITVDTNKGEMKQTSNSAKIKPNSYKPSPTSEQRPKIKGISVVNIEEGSEEVIFTCEYPAMTQITVLWNEVDDTGTFKNLALVDSIRKTNGRYMTTVELEKSNLVIKSPTRDHSGKSFMCMVIFDDKTTSFSDPPTLLNVWYLDEPVITVSKEILYNGDSVILNCSVDSNPSSPLRVTWLKNNNTIVNNNVSMFVDDVGRLHIPDVSLEDSGQYQCTVKNDVFKGKTSSNFEISVIDYFIKATFNFDSETSIATCITEGHPTPSLVTIFYNGEKVSEGTYSLSLQINGSTWKPSRIACFARNSKINITTRLNKSDVDNNTPAVKKDLNNEQSSKPEKMVIGTSANVVIIVTSTIASIFLGFLPTYIVCKRREKRIHSYYQNTHYQSLQFTPGSGVYRGLDKSSNVAGSITSTLNKENASSKDDVIYEDL